MNYITACHTDAGTRKMINQDSMLIGQASADFGTVLLAAVCDGMGGLAKGEAASAALVRSLSEWFRTELPALLYGGPEPDELEKSWKKLICETDRRIAGYGERHGIRLGTTCTAFLAADRIYTVMHIGDSRACLLSDRLYQLTKDQTYVQREIDLGRMTPEQAAADPQRSVLLQCVGAGERIEPDFLTGRLRKGQCFLIGSDGFFHVLSAREIYERLNPAAAVSAEAMRESLTDLTELAKERQEKDNISALLVKTL